MITPEQAIKMRDLGWNAPAQYVYRWNEHLNQWLKNKVGTTVRNSTIDKELNWIALPNVIDVMLWVEEWQLTILQIKHPSISGECFNANNISEERYQIGLIPSDKKHLITVQHDDLDFDFSEAIIFDGLYLNSPIAIQMSLDHIINAITDKIQHRTNLISKVSETIQP